jgi:hypothetical protein
MIPIFRKMRKQLAAENKVGKYLRYAIGEIVLVVIGIVIALQINTWKNDVQNRTLEKVYLKNLQKDMLLQIEINQVQSDYEREVISKTDSALSFLDDKIAVEKLVELLNFITGRHTFVANNVTFENLGSTGNSIHIRKSEILNELIRYNQILEYTMMVINNNNYEIVDGQFGHFVANNDLGLSLDKNNKIFKEKEWSGEERYLLFQQLNKRKVISNVIIDRVDLLTVDTQELIEDIDSYLK